MSSKNEIANMALGHLGIGKSVVDFNTDRTSEADALRKFYDQARDVTLRDFDWAFARKSVALSLLEENPTDEWLFSYSIPSDCIKLIKLVYPGRRVDSHDNRVPFELAYGELGTEVHTDLEDAIAKYTVRATDEERFSEDFAIAFSMMLATLIAPRVTGADASMFTRIIFQQYQAYLAKARSAAANEAGKDVPPQSEFIRARD
jgi:hypothetical protein